MSRLDRLRHGIRERLLLALAVLVGATLAAGVIGWKGFSDTEQALQTLQEQSLKELAQVLTLAERSASLAAQAPLLTGATSSEQLADAEAQLRERLDGFMALALELPSLDTASPNVPTDVPAIVRQAGRYDGLLRALADVAHEGLEVRAALAGYRTAFDRLRGDVAQLPDEAAIARQRATLLTDTVGHLFLIEDPDEIDALQARFETALVRLAFGSPALVEQAVALRPVFLLRARDLSVGIRTRLLLAATNTLSAQLTRQVALVAQAVSEAADLRGAQAAAQLRSGKTALAGVVGLCVIVAFAAALYVMRRVVGNLRAVTAAMLGLAAGDRQVAVPATQRQDEIGDLARAFTVFREHAFERDDLARRLEENSGLLAAIFDNMSDGIALFGTDGGLAAWNPRFVALSGLPPGLIVKDSPSSALLAGLFQAGAEARTVDGQRVDTGALIHSQRRPVAPIEQHFPDGRVVEIHITAMPRGGFLASLSDLTERKGMERQLRQAQKMEAVGQLTGGIAHDFNNLLSAIIGNLQLIHDEPALSHTIRSRALRALDAADRGAAMTQRLLAFARRQTLQPEPVDVNLLINGMLDLLSYGLEEGISLYTVLSADLPMVLVDPGQLENTLLNLVVNSRDAVQGQGRIAIHTSLAGEMVQIDVRDTGIGMPPEILARVFEPFFTTKRFGQGCGLGLSMVYGFVRQSGGTVRITSRPGEGTTVILQLPKAPADALPSTRANIEPIGAAPGRGENILVVEDNAPVRATAIDLLTDLGYCATAAASAEAALELLHRGIFDLLMTDVMLAQGMNGPELAREAAGIDPKIRVLFCSGYARDALVANARLTDDMPVLEKPYRRETLAARLRQALGSADR